MFEFSLENGKTQFKGGLICLILDVIAVTIFVVFAPLVKDQGGAIAYTIIFGLLIGILSLLSLLKIIFGAVVYHAERTSNVFVQIDKDDYSSSFKEKKAKKVVVLEKQKEQEKLDDQKDIEATNAEVKRWYFDKTTGDLIVYLSNDLVYAVSGLDEKSKNDWKQLTWDQKTELFNTKLIKKAKLSQK